MTNIISGNKLILRNFTRVSEYLLYDLDEYKSYIVKHDKVEVDGFYIKKRLQIIGFFRKNDLLYFMFGKKVFCLEECEIIFKKRFLLNYFTIKKFNKKEFSITYLSKFYRVLLDDLSFNPYIGEDMHDFFLYIYNVMKDGTLKSNIFKKWPPM